MLKRQKLLFHIHKVFLTADTGHQQRNNVPTKYQGSRRYSFRQDFNLAHMIWICNGMKPFV